MKIAFCLFKYFPYGGLQNDFIDIARLCVSRGHQLVVYTCDWQGEVPAEFKVIRVACKAYANHTKYQRYYQQVKDSINQEDIDCVVGFNKMPGLDIYFASDPSYRTKQRPVWERLGSRYRHFMRFEEAVFGSASLTRILILSEAQQRQYQLSWNTLDDRFISMPPGIHRTACADDQAMVYRQEIREEFGLKDDDLLLLMIGSGFRTKGLDRALAALKALPEALAQSTYLIVIGQDKAGGFEKQAADLGLAGRVRILPGRDDIAQVMQAGDVLVHPAYREVAGKVILEAVVAGLPALVTDVCGYAQHVEKAKAGVVLEAPFDQLAMNQQLQQMMLSGNERQQWRENGIMYGQTQSLYAMAEAATDAIEAACRRK